MKNYKAHNQKSRKQSNTSANTFQQSVFNCKAAGIISTTCARTIRTFLFSCNLNQHLERSRNEWKWTQTFSLNEIENNADEKSHGAWRCERAVRSRACKHDHEINETMVAIKCSWLKYRLSERVREWRWCFPIQTVPFFYSSACLACIPETRKTIRIPYT